MLFDIITVVELLFDGQPYIISYLGSDWTHTHILTSWIAAILR